jgi:hypothetical protein
VKREEYAIKHLGHVATIEELEVWRQLHVGTKGDCRHRSTVITAYEEKLDSLRAQLRENDPSTASLREAISRLGAGYSQVPLA